MSYPAETISPIDKFFRDREYVVHTQRPILPELVR